MANEFYYCKNCLTTSLRPNASFSSDGICKPCQYIEGESSIDYSLMLRKLEQKIKPLLPLQTDSYYDCIVGVSGGKDSTRQALWVRDRLNLNPLLVCCSYPPKQMLGIGAENIENLIRLGFDVEIYNPAPETAAQLSLESFVKFGNVCKASEIALFSTVPMVAIERDIKIVFFGENPALQEGDDATMGVDEFDANQLRGLNTLTAGGLHWLRQRVDTQRSASYEYPSEDNFIKNDIQMLYLGPAWPDWDMEENAVYSVLEGLVTRPNEESMTGDITNASMLDEEFTNINMMIKYYKFGFGRATDLCNELIRAKKIDREQAQLIVDNYDGLCSDEIVLSYCNWTGIAVDYFWSIVNRYVNTDLFELTESRPQRKFEVGVPICE